MILAHLRIDANRWLGLLSSMANENHIIRAAMTILGRRTSKRKAKAARTNGKLGGRNKRAKVPNSGKEYPKHTRGSAMAEKLRSIANARPSPRNHRK